jgi:hypothetical protein
MKEVPINDLGEVMVVEDYSDDFANISFCNEEEELLNKMLIAPDKLDGVIAVLRGEQERLRRVKASKVEE